MLAIHNGPDWVGVSLPSPEDGNWSSFRNVVFSTYLEFRTMNKVHKPRDFKCCIPSPEALASPGAISMCRNPVSNITRNAYFWFISENLGPQVVIKFRQNWFRQEAKRNCLRSTNSLIMFGIRNNCLISGRSLLLYQFTKIVTKLTVIIIVRYHCYQHHTKFYRISSSQG
jgi:hypothetical protein